MAVTCDSILEVACDHKRKSAFERAVMKLKHSRIAGRDVLAVVDWHERPETVPCFGHDYRCECKQPMPYGVHRFFAVVIVLEGDYNPDSPDYSFWGRWIVEGRESEVCICGVEIPPDYTRRIGRSNLESAGEQFDARRPSEYMRV